MNIKKGDLIRGTLKRNPETYVVDRIVYITDSGFSGRHFYINPEVWDLEVMERAKPEPVVGMIVKDPAYEYVYVPRWDNDKEPWLILISGGERFEHGNDVWRRINDPRDDMTISYNPAEE